MALLHVKSPNGTIQTVNLECLNFDKDIENKKLGNGWTRLSNGLVLQWNFVDHIFTRWSNDSSNRLSQYYHQYTDSIFVIQPTTLYFIIYSSRWDGDQHFGVGDPGADNDLFHVDLAQWYTAYDSTTTKDLGSNGGCCMFAICDCA